MIFNKETRKLKNMAERIIEKKILKKIYKTSKKKEKEEVLKHIIKTTLDQGYNDILKKLKILENEKKDIFFIAIKLDILKYKIRIFEASFNKEDFNNVVYLFKDIEREIKTI